MNEERYCRFVQADVVRLALSRGEWIDVKTELNAGEVREMHADLIVDMRPGEPIKLDPKRVGLTKLVTWIVGWSLLNTQGRPEPVSESAINGLDQDTYREMSAAVDAHEFASDARRAARKNGRDGERESPAISPSPDAAAGVSSGFGN